MGCPGHLPPFFATLVLLEYTFLHLVTLVDLDPVPNPASPGRRHHHLPVPVAKPETLPIAPLQDFKRLAYHTC
eukprot:COSAG02_NODE_39112_length_421_cov_0.462733_1_plen_72_part_01